MKHTNLKWSDIVKEDLEDPIVSKYKVVRGTKDGGIQTGDIISLSLDTTGLKYKILITNHTAGGFVHYEELTRWDREVLHRMVFERYVPMENLIKQHEEIVRKIKIVNAIKEEKQEN